MNYVIPKGTTLVTNNVAIHSEPSNYSNADKFEPERFIDDTRSMYASSNGKVEFRDNYIYGWGRRICPGIYLVSISFALTNEMVSY
jgi:cytochrome P450